MLGTCNYVSKYSFHVVWIVSEVRINIVCHSIAVKEVDDRGESNVASSAEDGENVDYVEERVES